MTDTTLPVRHWRDEHFPFPIVWAGEHHPRGLAASLEADPRWTEVHVLTAAELAAMKAGLLHEAANDVFDTNLPAECAHYLRGRASDYETKSED